MLLHALLLARPLASAADDPTLDALAEDEEAGEEEAEAPPPQPVAYNLASGSAIVVTTKKTGIGAALAHDHAVAARGWSGTATVGPDGSCSVEVNVPTASLAPDEDATRQMVGLTGEVDAGQREDIKENMLAKDQLNASGHPNITFKSTSCAPSGGGLAVSGDLSIVGKAVAVSFTLGGYSADDGAIRGSANFTVNHSDFGIEPFSAAFGAIANDQPLTFHLFINGATK